VQFHSSEEPKEVDAVVRDEPEFILDDTLGQPPVRRAAQTDLACGCCSTHAGWAKPALIRLAAQMGTNQLHRFKEVLSEAGCCNAGDIRYQSRSL